LFVFFFHAIVSPALQRRVIILPERIARAKPLAARAIGS